MKERAATSLPKSDDLFKSPFLNPLFETPCSPALAEQSAGGGFNRKEICYFYIRSLTPQPRIGVIFTSASTSYGEYASFCGSTFSDFPWPKPYPDPMLGELEAAINLCFEIIRKNIRDVVFI
jgi:hypothetical protein